MNKVYVKWWQFLLTSIFSAWFYFMLCILPYSNAFPFMYMRYIIECPLIGNLVDDIAALVAYTVSALSMYKAMQQSNLGGIYFRLFASVLCSAFVTYFFIYTAILPYYIFLSLLGVDLL